MGYHRVGFEVVGVDILPQPNYPFEFIQDDVMEPAFVLDWRQFDAIHASPPCQRDTEMQSVSQNGEAHPDLIEPIRELLLKTGLPYVIENVPGARQKLLQPTLLCGSMFGLGVPSLDRELRRHRFFETNWNVGLVPSCNHLKPAVGIYGDHLRLGRRSSQGEFSGPRAVAYAQEALGIDWTDSWDSLKEAIPPAMTEFLGTPLLAHLREEVAA